MAILTKPVNPNKGGVLTFSLNKVDLAALPTVSADPYFSDMFNWAKVSISFTSTEGKQDKTLLFNANQTVPSATTRVTEYVRDGFELYEINIYDKDGGSLRVLNSDVVASQFGFSFGTENAIMTESGEELLTENGETLIFE